VSSEERVGSLSAERPRNMRWNFIKKKNLNHRSSQDGGEGKDSPFQTVVH
jgi:hypothetical protein